jgi:hypothetical protein
MGNRSATAILTMNDEEFVSAPRLIASIGTNSRSTVKSAIEAARKKCADRGNQGL